jgi:hypothetical protein
MKMVISTGAILVQKSPHLRLSKSDSNKKFNNHEQQHKQNMDLQSNEHQAQ